MKIILKVDKQALPSPHVTRTFYPAGTQVEVQPADNLPVDSDIKFWIIQDGWDNHAYGLPVYVDEFEPAQEPAAPQPAAPQPAAPQVVNHWGKWVQSDQPVTGVLQLNHAPEWVYDEISYHGINLACVIYCKDKRKKNACDNCEPAGDSLIGAWKRKKGSYEPDPKGDYSAIAREDVIEVVLSKTTRTGALCSPCYPGQVDLDTPGEFLGYCLPDQD